MIQNRLHEKIFKNLSLIFIIGLLALVVVNNWLDFNSNLYISLLTTLVVFYVGALQERISNDKLFKELFQYFNERYDKYNDLINECSRNPDKKLDQKGINLIIDYFNMCAEEYIWYKKGRIPDNIWTAWRKGILVNLDIPQIHEIYLEERKQDVSYYGFFGSIEK